MSTPAQTARNDAARGVYMARVTAEREAFVEDVDWLRRAGLTRRQIAARLGYTSVESFERRLERCGYQLTRIPR